MPLVNTTATQIDVTTLSAATHRVLENEDAILGALQNEAVETSDDKAAQPTINVPVENVEPGTEDTTLNEAEPPSFEPWAQQRRKMERLNAAIKTAIEVSDEPEQKATTESEPVDSRSISVSFNGEQRYLVPWKVGRSWRCMEAFFREWFAEDEQALKDITNGNFILTSQYSGLIHPSIWQDLVGPDQCVEFSREIPSGASTPPLTRNTELSEESESNSENKVQYKINYYRRRSFGERVEFVGESSYEEPVKFEVADEFEKLPALEERRGITFWSDSIEREAVWEERKARPPILRRTDELGEATLKINSPYLLNILKSVIEYSAEPLEGDNKGLDVGIVEFPYKDLYYHLDDLRKYKEDSSELRAHHSADFNSKADQHISVLTNFLEDYPTIALKEARARWEKPVPLTTFATFWLLMKPGSDAYVRETDGSLSRYVVDRVAGGIQEVKGKRVTKKYTVELWNLVKGLRSIMQYSRKIYVQVFDDERKIVDLPVFPARFQDEADDGAVRKQLLDRGKKYFEYAKRPCFLQYTGQGLKPGAKSYKRTRVVVEHESAPWSEDDWGSDLEQFMLRIPPGEDIGGNIRIARCECKECDAHTNSPAAYAPAKFSDYYEISPGKVDHLTDHQYLLLPSHVFGFILKDRSYDLLDVATLKEPSMADAAIERLVIQPGNKEIIKAVAKTYTDSSARFSADFIYGKGEGQIILLHGPPGTGKTLTAESVAEFTKRPLLSITAADLGHEPEALERSLLRYFRRANDWDAIVLLDEADVYLEKRSTSDLARNSIVSVFLRALDYFQGILFLTTNRVGQFDEAFMSRIHLPLGYDKLTDDSRAQIWENLFQKLQEDHERNDGPEIRYDYMAKEYVMRSKEVTDLAWNGREIRNAFQTAVALAVYDSKHKNKGPVPKVMESHLKQVVSMSSAFRTYMKAAHQGKNDSDMAYQQGNRDDRASSTLTKG